MIISEADSQSQIERFTTSTILYPPGVLVAKRGT